MAMTWDERVLDAISSASEVPPEQFERLCKMAVLLFHSEAPSRRRLTRTASACGWSEQETETNVLAIAKILMDAAKLQTSDLHFQSSISNLNIPKTHVEVLAQLYADHRAMIKQSSSRDMDLRIPQYRALDWRIDLEIANRSMRNRPEPIVTLALHTATTSSAGDSLEGLPTRQTTCMRVDYAHLTKLQRQLETALREVDSVHCTRMQRYLH
ncbi:hypothetical protein ATCC90586_006239 [Pythium insidiosum]|nr:hypothetical protein ATCC90586_006239 [Pythium insidiosum]